MAHILHGIEYSVSDDHADLWYPDGDHCATIRGNLGLDITADEVARLICTAIKKHLESEQNEEQHDGT